MKMEFYFDVDGVILDFETSFMDFVRDTYRPDLPAGYQPKYWELSTEFPDIDMGEAWEIFVASDRFASLKPLVTASIFNQLTHNCQTCLVTNIPDHLVEKRKQNLKACAFEYTELYCAGHWDFGIKNYPQKPDIINKLHKPGHSIVFLDDHPTNCREVAEKVPEAKVFLMSRKHNADHYDDCWKRVNNWDELVKAVKRLG